MMKKQSIFPAVAEMAIGLLLAVLGWLAYRRGSYYYEQTQLTGRGVVFFIIAGVLAAAFIAVFALGILQLIPINFMCGPYFFIP